MIEISKEPGPVLGNPYSFMYSKDGPISVTHTVRLRFDADVAENILHGLYYLLSRTYQLRWVQDR